MNKFIDKLSSVSLALLMIVAIMLTIALIASPFVDIKKPIKKDYETICIGGWQYELIMNEFNEPLECGRD